MEITHAEHDERGATKRQVNQEEQMELRAIRADDDLDWALAEIEQYFDTPPAPGTKEADRFDILTDLIEAYENREYPVEALDPIETLKVFMDIKKKKQSDLAKLVGGKSRASEIMNRKRPLTLRMIQKINTSWKIPAASLIAPYHLEANGERA
ncbi:XRE family transcriptional regulator [uncultured Sulfitobacter sp.]|uniref:helix-turn-helix domain-containing protein n=1 Tax=uncultured Sulfitobacter sp. TaxID=191468 RepID=UPI0025F64A67|nr:XRE family transcriptional regulator [uncultured Sulfitobacter sp.]